GRRRARDARGANRTRTKTVLLCRTPRRDSGSPEPLKKARPCESLLARTMKIPSRIARALRPPLLELGLLEAIEWEAGEFQKRMEIPCTVKCASHDIPIDPELGNALFSVFRETLT